MSTPAPEKWGKLARSELKFLDALGLDMVMAAQELGATARVSATNHVIVRAPDGKDTISVSRTLASQNRAAQNAHAQFKRVFGMSLDQAKNAIRDRQRDEARQRVAKEQEAALAAAESAPRPTIECGLPGCTATFATDGARYAHLSTEPGHYPCDVRDCRAVLPSPQGRAGHKRIVHEGHKPRAGTGGRVKVRPVPEPVLEPVAKAEPDTEVEESLDHLESAMEAKTMVVLAKPTSDAEKIEAIRKLIGEDEDLKTERDALRAELDEVKAERDLYRQEYEELHAKWAKFKEMFD